MTLVTSPDTPAGPTRCRCPVCGGPVTWEDNPARPFCSRACKLIDLGDWLDERFRLPGDAISTEAAPDPQGPRLPE
jgi:endogenous inhibitor of DNA gyrase (YacG/DUF329 family)